MGRRKAVYQRFVPNPPQDHSEGQVPHKVTTRDGQGVAAGVLALDSLLRSADSRCFWGRRSTAPLPGESAGPSTTGNRKSAALSKWGRLKHTGKIALVEENSTHSISQARACHFFFFRACQFGRSAISQQKGPREGTALLAPTATGHPLPCKH